MGGGDIVNHRRSSYLSGCMSPSCVAVHEEYSRINISRHHDKNHHHHKSRKLRKLIRKVVNESKSIYGGPTKPITFQYDAVSYSQNFDDGCHGDDDDDYFMRCHQVFQDSKRRHHHVIVHTK